MKSIPMQSKTHFCIASPSSSKLSAKQGQAKSATSAKRNRFSASSFLKFQIPRVSASRNRGAHFAFPNQISPFRPWRPLREQSAFTLIELMAATTVLSIILLMMVGMQDQMSKAWSNANRRTDATREARAGLRMLTEDFLHYFCRDVFTNSPAARSNYNPITNRIPIVYFGNASSAQSGLTVPNAQNNSQALFFLSQRRPGTNSTADQITAVGYYIAWDTNTSVSGFPTTNYHLYRYVNTNIMPCLSNYFANPSSPTALANLFPNVGPSLTNNNEILARNAVNLRIYFYGSNIPATGPIYKFPEADSASTTYSGNRCVFELTTFPDTVANSFFQGNLTNWTSSNNIRRYGRTFEVSMDLERGLAN